MRIILTDKWENITLAQRSTWNTAYPAINLDQELAKAKAWIDANPKNRKSNWERFLNNWFKSAQDKAPKVNEAHGLEMIKKAKSLFQATQKDLENRLQIQDKSLEEVKLQMDQMYQTMEDFIAMMSQYYARSDGVKSKTGFAYEMFARWWKLGCEKWGSENLKTLWKKHVVS